MSDFFTIFPTTVARYKYTDPGALKSAITDLINSESVFRVGDTENSRHFYELNPEFIQNPKLEHFKNFILESVHSYISELMMLDTEMIITDIWINQSNTGFKQKMHNHANSFISGTYYVNFDPLKHSKIMFHKNSSNYSLNPYFEFDPVQINEFNANKFIIANMDEGDLVIWPSQLEHGYEIPNLADNRISISMNFLPSRINNGMYSFKISKL